MRLRNIYHLFNCRKPEYYHGSKREACVFENSLVNLDIRLIKLFFIVQDRTKDNTAVKMLIKCDLFFI